MSLLHPALLAGLALATIPILLHLLMRAKPKRLLFPALRLIQQRRRQNTRRMNLRHIWLLLLRVAVIVLVVLAVCRPSLPPANYSLTGFEWTTLLGIGAIAAATYFGVMQLWQRRGVTRNVLLTRRTMLRGGVGAAALLLALLGVAWPYAHRISAEIKSPAPRSAENIPVAAVFLFDTSVSMSYKQANQTRLQAAQDVAKTHLSHLPSGSKVSVTSSNESTPAAFSTDLVAARSRIDTLEIKAVSQSLNDRLNSLLQAQEDDRRRVANEQTSVPTDKRQDRFVREIYLFTDLSKSAWREESSTLLRDELERLRWIGIYVIDVGEQSPTNIALTEMKLSREAVPVRSAVRVEAIVSSVGPIKPEQSIELFLKVGDGPLVRKGTESVKLEAGNESRVSFYPVEMPSQAYTQGELRIAGSDPIAADDVVYFTVQTIPSLKVLVVAERPAVSRFWTMALKFLTEERVSAFHTENATPEQLVDRDLSEFDLICLINVSKPTDAAWKKLQSFVEGGGGLGVFLGASSSLLTDSSSPDLINPIRYQSAAALAVLPAKLGASLTHSPALTMDLRKSQHTLLQRIEGIGALDDLGAVEITKYWKVEPTAEASVIARYITQNDDGSGAPALVERRLGRGRVVMMTTGVDGVAWNDLLHQESGIYFVLADQLMQYLSAQASGTFNHIVGDEVSLPMDRERKLAKAILRMPDFKQRVIDIPADSRMLTVRDAASAGSYSLDSADRTVDHHVGFSLNLPTAESDLKRLEKNDLDGLLGEGRYSVNRDPGSLERNVNTGRLGQEMYSMVVAILVVVFALEQFTATWFYRTDES